MTDQDHPLSLQIWDTKSGAPTLNAVDAGSFDVWFGHERKLSIRNPNSTLWADISELHTVLHDSWIEKPHFIAPLSTVEITYKIKSNHEETDFGRLDARGRKDSIKGEITWCELVYPEGSQ